jgi:hypothetical protein
VSAETENAKDKVRDAIEDFLGVHDREGVWNLISFYADSRYEDGRERGWNDGFDAGRSAGN